MSFNNSPPLFPPPPELCSSAAFWSVARLLSGLTMVLIVVTNVLMLLVTWRAMSSRINPFFFVSLAMSDLLTGLLVLPFDLHYALQAGTGSDPGAGMCTFSGVSFHILQCISLYSFFALSLDRLLSIAFPLKYPTIITVKVNIVCVVILWLLPIALYGSIPVAGLGLYVYKCWQSMCNLGPVQLDYLTFLMLSSVAIFLATYAINGYIFYVARQQQAKIDSLQQQIQGLGGKLRLGARMKAARSILVALSLFTLCWGPYYSALFCFVLFNAMITPLTEFSLLWIAISNSYMNFFVFLATYRSFRLEFLRMFGFKNRVEDTTNTASTG